jgi:hypothetical protein
MHWIKDRILSEFRKHKNLDWALIAEKKIVLKQTELENQRIMDVAERLMGYYEIGDLESIKELAEELTRDSKCITRYYHS